MIKLFYRVSVGMRCYDMAKIWINNALRRSIWRGLDRELNREFSKWDGYPRNPYGDSCIREDCSRLYWNGISWAFKRQYTYNGLRNPVIFTAYGFKWSDVVKFL